MGMKGVVVVGDGSADDGWSQDPDTLRLLRCHLNQSTWPGPCMRIIAANTTPLLALIVEHFVIMESGSICATLVLHYLIEK